LLLVRLCKKHDTSWSLRRIFLPHAHEYVVKKWLDKELDNVPVRAKFTKGALEFVAANRAGESLLINLSRHYVGSRKGPSAFPCIEVRFSVADSGEDFVKVQSNAEISVLVEREIYEVFKQQKIPLIIVTSGLWKFKKLALKHDVSWRLYTKEELQRKERERKERRRSLGPT
jgi:hypothetical protein